MKVFVSQPIQGRTKDDLVSGHASTLSKGMNYLGLSPAETVEVPMIGPSQLSGQHPVYCLGLNLQMMCQADVVLFEPGWTDSKASRLEHYVCEVYGIRHVDVPAEEGETRENDAETI